MEQHYQQIQFAAAAAAPTEPTATATAATATSATATTNGGNKTAPRRFISQGETKAYARQQQVVAVAAGSANLILAAIKQ